MQTPRQPLVRLQGVVKRFGDTVALDGLDLVVERGQIVALLGANGAGKSTTLDICEGFAVPDRGKVRILGLDPVVDRDRIRPRVGVMLQGGGAYPGIRALEMLELAAGCAREPHDPRWLLDVLGLTAVSNTAYRRLSGGQRQRLSLACALVGRPELVFLDEPSSGLDPAAKHLVCDLLDCLRQDGVAVLLTTHALEDAEALADRVIILDRGRVCAEGSVDDLLRIGGEQCITFHAESGLDLAELRAALGNSLRIEELTPGTYVVDGDINPNVVAAVATWGDAKSVLVSGLRVDRRNLEAAFLDLTSAPADIR